MVVLSPGGEAGAAAVAGEEAAAHIPRRRLTIRKVRRVVARMQKAKQRMNPLPAAKGMTIDQPLMYERNCMRRMRARPAMSSMAACIQH